MNPLKIKLVLPFYMVSNEFISLAYIFIVNYSMSTMKNVYLQSKSFTLQTYLEREAIPQLGSQ